MAFIKSMYAIEKKIAKRKKSDWALLSIDDRAEQVKAIRQQETVPLLNNFGQWLRQMQGLVLPKSDLGEAIRYTLNQWDALQVFTTNVEPFAYLVNVLHRLPTTPREQLSELLPHRWKPLRAASAPADPTPSIR